MNYEAEVELARRILSETPDKWPTRAEIARMARALLSLSAEVKGLREALEKIRRTPSMPFPDPGAHSWQAYAVAVRWAWIEIQNIAYAALSPIPTQGDEQARSPSHRSAPASTTERIRGMLNTPIGLLAGKTLISISINAAKDVVTLTASDGSEYQMYHSQDCCESVGLADVAGDLGDLLNTPIVSAEEVTNSEEPKPDEYSESFTWTFYKFATAKGRVTLRWLGESNGYYSEAVDFVQTKAATPDGKAAGPEGSAERSGANP